MNLKILLPFKVFADISNVTRVVAETNMGVYGFQPQRLDCTVAIRPGILTYETSGGGKRYLATDEGILVKAGLQIFVSVRNAMGDAPLGKLRQLVESELQQLSEQEIQVRSVVAKLESGFIRSIEKLRSH